MSDEVVTFAAIGAGARVLAAVAEGNTVVVLAVTKGKGAGEATTA